MKPLSTILLVLLVFTSLWPSRTVKAQTESSAGPVYVVQEGDSIWDIAYRFHVSQADLIRANGISDVNQITIGQSLVIPGLEGIQGVLATATVPFGETLHSLSLRYEVSTDTLKRLNHLTTPNELYAGYSLVILDGTNPGPAGKRSALYEDQSLFELAVLNNTDTWAILSQSRLESSSAVLPGDTLRIPGDPDAGPGALPPGITHAGVSRFTQGQTAEIVISGNTNLEPQGTLMGYALNFYPYTGTLNKLSSSMESEFTYISLQGIHAMAEPGLFPLTLSLPQPDGSIYEFSQDVLVTAGDFLYDIPLSVDPATLDPEITVPEDTEWYNLASAVSPERMWQGELALPVEPVFAECYASRFGSRRSYNGSEYKYFHTGLDYCGQIGDPIYATASGTVVFAGLLTVRGNATMIDHGWGVFSAYMHQSELLVNVGDHVEQGQLIGRVGNTGRVEGPHLHFEVLVGGVQVNPLDWLDSIYP